MMDAEGIGSTFDRAQFLLGKQLVYFERYGRAYLPDVALLEDRAFFEALLADTEDDTNGANVTPAS
jgi:hypothetical protein